MPKFAVYYIAQGDDPFYQLGSQILGYDVRLRQSLAPSSEHQEFAGLYSGVWTTVSRPYGFHATITEALDCQWASIPRVEQEVSDLLKCFDPEHTFLLERQEDHPIGMWGEEGRRSIVLLYEPNVSLRMFHTLLVARITSFGTGSDFLKRYLTDPKPEMPPHLVQQIRLFSSPTVFDNWYPHFTLLNPYTGEEAMQVASHVARLFEGYKQHVVKTICLLIQSQDEEKWQIYREFQR